MDFAPDNPDNDGFYQRIPTPPTPPVTPYYDRGPMASDMDELQRQYLTHHDGGPDDQVTVCVCEGCRWVVRYWETAITYNKVSMYLAQKACREYVIRKARGRESGAVYYFIPDRNA